MVRIVTDSTSDLPPELAKDLGITVVPAYVHFGTKSYLDGVDINPERMYDMMVRGPIHPTTSSCSPGDFSKTFKRLSVETDEIICLTATSKKSALYEAAKDGKRSFNGKPRIEVVDSQSVTMGLGLLAMLGAKQARQEMSIDDILAALKNAIPRTYGVAMLDTAKYVLRGGRLGEAGAAFLGAVLKVKIMLEIKRDGNIETCGIPRTRTRESGLKQLCEYVQSRLPVEDIAVVSSGTNEEAMVLAKRLESITSRRPIIAKLGSALGVHAGPGAILVAFISKH